MWLKERTYSCKLSSDLNIQAMACSCLCPHITTYKISIYFKANLSSLARLYQEKRRLRTLAHGSASALSPIPTIAKKKREADYFGDLHFWNLSYMLGVTLLGVVHGATTQLVGHPCAPLFPVLCRSCSVWQKPFTNFELIFVTGVCVGGAFSLALLSVNVQFFQHHVLKMLSFLGCFCFVVSCGLSKQALCPCSWGWMILCCCCLFIYYFLFQPIYYSYEPHKFLLDRFVIGSAVNPKEEQKGMGEENTGNYPILLPRYKCRETLAGLG